MFYFSPFTLSDSEVSNQVQNILLKERPNVNRKEAMRFILSAIDLTTLNGDDTDAVVTELCNKAVSFKDISKNIPSTAAVCVYPPFVSLCKTVLKNTNIKVASVAGAFPAGQSPIEVKVAEVAYAVAQGADEIDMVISRGKFLEGKYDEVGSEIVTIKKACKDVHLKVILETGELKTASNIRKASEIAIFNGGDFIKTSTGKISPAATLEAAYVMMLTIKDHFSKTGKMVGFKPAGGISDADTALDYYILIKSVLGNEWLTPKYIRFGASKLATSVYHQLI